MGVPIQEILNLSIKKRLEVIDEIWDSYEIGSDGIIIYSIYHCARDPQVWKRRGDA